MFESLFQLSKTQNSAFHDKKKQILFVFKMKIIRANSRFMNLKYYRYKIVLSE